MRRWIPRLSRLGRTLLDPPLFWKLTVPMTVVVGLSTLGSLASLRVAHRADQLYARRYRDHVLDDRAISRLSATHLHHFLGLSRLVEGTDARTSARTREQLARLEQDRQGAVALLLRRLRGTAPAQRIARQSEHYSTRARALLALERRGERRAAAALAQHQLRPLLAQMATLTAELEAREDRLRHDDHARARQRQQRSRWLTLALHGAGALLALLISLLVARVLAERMRLLVECAVALGQGELGARVKLQTRDEFGALAERLNAMARRLTRLFVEIQRQHTALHDSEQRLQAIVENSTAAICLKDEFGRYLLVNQRFADLAGLPASELIGKTDEDLFAPDISRSLTASDRAVLADGKPLSVEEVYAPQAGAPVFLVLKFALRDAKERPYAVCSLASDITARKEVERLKGEFVAVVSHELRTPLTAIRGALGLLEGGVVGALPPKALELTTLARQNTERLVRLINDILDLEKLEAGKLRLNARLLSVAELIAQTVRELTPLAKEAGITIDTGTIDGALELTADRDRLIQVLTNLLGNAIKFSPSGTTVMLSAGVLRDDRLRIGVTNQGPGITAEQQQLLFRKFQQLDGSDARRKGGTGLGLAIARAIVEQHGGRIGVESAPGRGTTFFFELPREQQVYEI